MVKNLPFWGKLATLSLGNALKTTFANRPFLIYLAGNVAFWLGFNIVTLNIAPYVTVLLGGTEGDVAIYFGLVMVVALLCFPLVNILSKKLGLKAVMLLSMILFALLLPGIYWLGEPLFGLAPQVFGCILMALMGIPLSAIFIVNCCLFDSRKEPGIWHYYARKQSMSYSTRWAVYPLDADRLRERRHA